jgi:predicted nucleotidyltransferase
MNLFDHHFKDIRTLCKTYKVKTLYAFGSVLTDQFKAESDLDIVVDLENIDILEYGDNYYDLKFSVETILKRNVDLLEEKAVKNAYFRHSLTKTKY